MAAEARQKIVSAALDMTNMLINMGFPEPKIQQEKPPPILFDIPHPKPLRETLLKLKVHKETVNKLNQIYISQVDEYRSKTMQELQSLWSCLHLEGSRTPLLTWEKVLRFTQRKTQETLDAWFDMVVDRARDLVANLSAEKRKNQPVFDQRITDFLLWYFAGPGGSQNPSRDEKKKLAVSTGLTYRQVDIWFQNRRARTKKKMAKTGITDLQEALGNPKRPDFANLPDPIREVLSKKKQNRKEMKILNKRIERLKQKGQERTNKPKRVKVELTRSLLREDNEPALDWICPRAQGEKSIRDKFISGELQGINSWSAPAYVYPTEWSNETRDAWRQADMLWVPEFEHKSTPHPDEPKDVTVTDEEMDALTKQFAGLKIEVLKKIYWHQYPDGRLEAIHPKLVRVRKDGTFFMYDDEELQGNPKLTTTPLPQSTRPRRGDRASDPIIIKDSDRSGQRPIVFDIPRASAAVPTHDGESSESMIVDVPGASVTDPITVGMIETPVTSAPLRVTNPIVIVSIPDATEDDMELTSQVKVKGAGESKGNGRTTSFEMPAPSSLAAGDAVFARELDVSQLGLPPSSYPHENGPSSLPPGIFDVPRPGTLPAKYLATNSTPSEVAAIAVHPDQLRTLDEGLAEIFGSVDTGNTPQTQILPACSAPLAIDPVHTNQPRTLDQELSEFFESMNTYNVPQKQFLPINPVPYEVPAVVPIYTDQPRTLEDELAEFFESINSYHVPQAQILPQIDSDWNAVFAPPTTANMYQSIPEVSAREWTRWDGLGPPSCRLQHWKSLPRHVSSPRFFCMQR